MHHVVRGGADDIFAHIERIRDEVSESMVLVADYLLKQREQVAVQRIRPAHNVIIRQAVSHGAVKIRRVSGCR